METKKVVLCLDWSNLLFRSLYINQIYGDKGTYDNIEDCKSFVYKMTSDICSIINIFRPDNVVFLTDSPHAWRKDILSEEAVGYKGARQKSDVINWENIFKCADDLKKIFKKTGAHIAEMDRAEADDLAALCKEKVWEKFPNYNMVIVSADADLRQLIDFNPITKQYCAVYNTITKGKTGKRYFYVSQAFKEWLESPDEVDIFFSNVDYNKQYVKEILKENSKIELEIEDADSIVVHKIFCGDDGDSVPAFYSWVSNGKPNRITPAKEKKIKDALGITTVNDIITASAGLKPVFESICKKEVNDIDINERLERQRRLVELNSELFPAEIQDYKDTVEYMLAENLSHETVFKAADILKGTQYEGYDQKKVIEAAVFKEMDKYGLNITPIF